MPISNVCPGHSPASAGHGPHVPATLDEISGREEDKACDYSVMHINHPDFNYDLKVCRLCGCVFYAEKPGE